MSIEPHRPVTFAEEHSNVKCKVKCPCCFRFHKRITCRAWQILLFLLFIAGVSCILIALFDPWNSNGKNSKKDVNEGVNRDNEDTTGQTTNSTTGIPTATSETSAKTTATSTETPNEGTTEQTTKRTTGKATAASKSTSVPGHEKPLQCGVAIVGGGTAGLVMAYTLLSNKEKSVCVFEKENRLGGKLFDHRFPAAPNVIVGLGELHIHGNNSEESGLFHGLVQDYSLWQNRKVRRVESHGVYEDSFDSLKRKVFPTLLHRPPTNNKTIGETAKLVDGRNVSDYSTAGRFLSSFLSPEGAKWMTDAYGFKGGYMESINPESYKKYLEEKRRVEDLNRDERRPFKGMSELIEELRLKVRNRNGKIYLQEAVTSVSKQGNKFVLVTRNFTVLANKTVLTAGPEALKKMTGDVIQNITNHEIFKSIVSVPAFSGAAVYPTAWWNDTDAAQKNNSLQPLQMFVSSSNCLGITMPYASVSTDGNAVLHTIANNGGCSDQWGNILKISKNAVDKEMNRALEYKFQRTIPEPLDTVYKYWEEGFWYLQKAGASFSLTDLRQWAKKPLAANEIFLAGRAFYSFGGTLEDDILSTREALMQGWKIQSLPWLRRVRRSSNIRPVKYEY